jgi:HPt (histidine-containing phosphotransfer) domain-containing protein
MSLATLLKLMPVPHSFENRNNNELKQELLQAYFITIPEHLEALTIAIATKEYAQIEREAHFIKGSSSAIGISGIARLASLLGESGKNKKACSGD